MTVETRHAKLNAKSCRTPLPQGVKELVIADTTLTGFRLRITARARRYVMTGRVKGGGRRTVTIGDADAMTLPDARKAAQTTRNAFLSGEDVAPRADADHTFKATHEARHDLWSQGKLRSQKKAPSPRTVAAVQVDIRRALAFMGSTPVANVDMGKARAFVASLEAADVGPDTKRRAMGEASRVMDYAVSRGLVDLNPFKLLTNFTGANSRDRVLTVDEVRSLWDTAAGMGTARNLLRLLIAQPLRLSCATHLRWGDVDLESGVMILRPDLPGNKARIPLELALTPTAIRLLTSLPRGAPAGYVLAGRTAGSRVWWTADRAAAYAKLHGIPDLRLHDMRTAFASLVGDRPGADTDALDRMLAHKRSGVEGKYQRSSRLDAQRDMGRLWSDALDR